MFLAVTFSRVLPWDETRCVDAERRARQFGGQIKRCAWWAGRQKNKKTQNAVFGRNHFFTQQLTQETNRGKNLEFFQ